VPVIVIGADTPLGEVIVPALDPKSGELRVFVSDPERGQMYRGLAKVAVGDLSDGSHVGGASIGAFCAVVVAGAAHDDRERSFARTVDDVFAQWEDGLSDAGVARVIVVGSAQEVPVPDPLRHFDDYRRIDTTGRSNESIAAEVAEMEAAP
jgi:putative NADH-flavin reductase